MFVVMLVGSRSSGNNGDIEDFKDDEGDDAGADESTAAVLDTTTTTTTTNSSQVDVSGGLAVDVIATRACYSGAVESVRGSTAAGSPVGPPALEPIVCDAVDDDVKIEPLEIEPVGDAAAGDIGVPAPETAPENGARMVSPSAMPAAQFVRPPPGSYCTSVIRSDGEIVAQFELDHRYSAPPR